MSRISGLLLSSLLGTALSAPEGPIYIICPEYVPYKWSAAEFIGVPAGEAPLSPLRWLPVYTRIAKSKAINTDKPT